MGSVCSHFCQWLKASMELCLSFPTCQMAGGGDSPGTAGPDSAFSHSMGWGQQSHFLTPKQQQVWAQPQRSSWEQQPSGSRRRNGPGAGSGRTVFAGAVTWLLPHIDTLEQASPVTNMVPLG